MLYHEYFNKLRDIATPESLKTGKAHLFVKNRPTASDEADTIMFAAIIYQGEARHTLYILNTLIALNNPRERQICATADTGLRIEAYALRYRPESPLFQTAGEELAAVDKSRLDDIRKTLHTAISHGVRHFRPIFGQTLEFRSGTAGDLNFVSVPIPKSVLNQITQF